MRGPIFLPIPLPIHPSFPPQKITNPPSPTRLPTFFETSPTPETNHLRHKLIPGRLSKRVKRVILPLVLADAGTHPSLVLADAGTHPPPTPLTVIPAPEPESSQCPHPLQPPPIGVVREPPAHYTQIHNQRVGCTLEFYSLPVLCRSKYTNSSNVGLGEQNVELFLIWDQSCKSSP